MKRYISLVLAAVVLICSLAVPSLAADFENVEWYQLLDYVSLNSSGNTTNINNSNVCYFAFNETRWISSVDIIVSFIGQPITRVYHTYEGTTKNLSILKIGDNLYRIYGNITRSPYNGLHLTFESSGWTRIEFTSVKLLGIEYGFFEESAHGYGTVVRADDLNIGYNYQSLSSSFYYTYSGDFNDRVFRTYYQFPNWRKYDYIDLQLYYVVDAITSISATIGDINIPVSCSYLDPTQSGSPGYFMTLRLDLTGLLRSSTDEIELQIIGLSSYDSSGLISIIGCSGYVPLNTIDPLFYHFRTLQVKLEGWFSSLGDRIVNALNGDSSASDQFKDQIDQSNQELEDMSSVMNSFTTPDINSINVDVGAFVSPSDISSLTAPMSLLFESNIVTTCIMISIILATVMFVLYGKR